MAPLQRLVSPIQATEQLQIQHFTHQHLLQKLHMTSEFNCDGCNIVGYGVRYRCSPCEFDLHEQCAVSPQRINSHLHPHHQLVLVNRPGDSHFCYVCRGLTNGLCYTCECQTCEFDVHPLCTTGVPSVTMDCGQQTGGVSQLGQPVPTTTPQPVIIHQYQHQQQQGIPIMINQQHQPQQDTPPIRSVGGVNHTQPMLVNHHHYQQPQQGIRTTAFGGFQGTNGNQHHGMQQQQQQQRLALPAVNGYQGMRTNQEVMINNQQQRQGLPAVGYNIVNNNQTVMITQPPPPPPPQYYPQQSSGIASNYENYARMAANLVSTTLIGVPIFNPRN